MKLSNDMYEYITNFVDNKTIIRMLSVNKKFNTNIYFERIFKKRYPLLENLEEKENCIQIMMYLNKLEKEFGIPYISYKRFNPMEFYEENCENENILNVALIEAVKSGNLKTVKYLIEENNADDFNNASYHAQKGGNKEIINYLLFKETIIFL